MLPPTLRVFDGAKLRIIFESAKNILQMLCFLVFVHGDGADEY